MPRFWACESLRSLLVVSSLQEPSALWFASHSLCPNDKAGHPFLSGCGSLVCAPKPLYVDTTGPCVQNYINFSLKLHFHGRGYVVAQAWGAQRGGGQGAAKHLAGPRKVPWPTGLYGI